MKLRFLILLWAVLLTRLGSAAELEVVITEPASVTQYADAISIYLHGFDIARGHYPDLELRCRMVLPDGTAGATRVIPLDEPWEKPGIILRKDAAEYAAIQLSAISGTNVLFRRLYPLGGTEVPTTRIPTLAQNAFIEPGQFMGVAPQIPQPDQPNLNVEVIGPALRTNHFDAATLHVRSDINHPLVSSVQLAALSRQTDFPNDPTQRSIYIPLKSQLYDQATGNPSSVLHYLCEIPLDPAWLAGTEDEILNLDPSDIKVHWTDQVYQGRNILGHTGGGLGQGSGTMAVDVDGNIYFSHSMRADVVRFHVQRQAFEIPPVDMDNLSNLYLPTDDDVLGNGGTGSNGKWNGFKMVDAMNHASSPRMLFGRTINDIFSNDTYGWAGLFILPLNWDDPVAFTNEFDLLIGSWPTGDFSFYDALPTQGGPNRRIQYFEPFGDCIYVKNYPGSEGGPWRVDLDAAGTVTGFGTPTTYPGTFGDYTSKPRDIRPSNATMLDWQDYGLVAMERNDLYQALTGTNTSAYAGWLEVNYDVIGHMLLNPTNFSLILDNIGGPSLAPHYMATPAPGQDQKLIGVAEYGYYLAEFDLNGPTAGEVKKEYLTLDTADPSLELPMTSGLGPYGCQWCDLNGDDWLYIGGYTGLSRFQYTTNGVPKERFTLEKFHTDLVDQHLDAAGAGSIKRHRYLEHGLDDRMFLTGTHTAGRGGTGYSGGLLSFHKTQRDTLWRLSYMSRCYNTVQLRSRIVRETDDSPLQEFSLVGGVNLAYIPTLDPADVPANTDPKIFLYDAPTGGGMRDRFGFNLLPGASGWVYLGDIAYSQDRRYLIILYEDRLLTFDLQTNQYIDGRRLTFGNSIYISTVLRPTRRLIRAPDDRLLLCAAPSDTSTTCTFLDVRVAPDGTLSFSSFLELAANSSSDMKETFGAQHTFLPDIANDDGSYDLFLGHDNSDTDCRLIKDFLPPRRIDPGRSLNVLSLGVGGATISGTKPGATPYRADCVDGETVQLTANPPAGFVFEEWQDEDGNSLGAGTLQIDMTVDRCIMAVFAPDTDPPGMMCPADRTLECSASTDPADTGIATATFHCATAPVIQFSDTMVAGNCPQSRTIFRVWTATDACGNSASCTQTLTVVDSEAPAISCPADLLLACDAGTNTATTGLATATDNCDAPAIRFADTIILGACPQSRTIFRVWTATDPCGNSASCTQTLTVVDSEAPVISCPADLLLACDASTNTAATGLATATDTCDNAPAIRFADTVTAGACPQSRTIFRVWTATDPCGNSASCTQTLTVVDSEAPVISCPADLLLACDAGTNTAATGLATATDTCDNAPAIRFADTVTAGACPQSRTISRVWTATDACGNSASCTQTLTVVDSEAPAISCPADLLLACDAGTNTATTGLATATDNCDAPAIRFADTIILGACPQSRTIARVWTATDACGNAATCTQTLTVVDSEAPAISCPTDLLLACDADTNTAATGLASATDTCDNAPAIRFADTVTAGACPQSRTISRVWTATDACGNSASCTQTLTVVDSEAPAISCPADLLLACDAGTNTAATGLATATDTCDDALAIRFADTVTVGACPQSRIIARVWTATDACGNSTSCTQTLTLVDSKAPTISCPADLLLACDAGTNTAATGLAAATDTCGNALAIHFVDTVTAGACPQSRTIARVWTATDACGNSASCTQALTVVDSEAPAISCPADLLLACDAGTNTAATGLATATDNCDNAPAIRFADTIILGNCPQSRTIARVWTATDACGNSASCTQTLTVVDSQAPAISCPADLLLACDAGTNTAATGLATATDNCDDAPAIRFNDTVTAGACPQSRTIARVWTATDACGNSASCTQTLTVVDSQAPAISCPADLLLACDAGTNTAATGLATATDTCDNAPAIRFNDTVTAGACPQSRTIARVWTATDACGNSASCTQTLTVVDSQAPAINCPADLLLACDASTNTAATGLATATDTCDNAPAIRFADTIILGACPQSRTIARVWTATDACGNSISCTQTITTVDNLAPSFDAPPDVTVNFGDPTDPAATGTASNHVDACDLAGHDFVDMYTPFGSQAGLITRSWRAWDSCGNTNVEDQLIEVISTNGPFFDLPPDTATECDASTNIADLGTISNVVGACNLLGTNVTDQVVPGACSGAGEIRRIWTVFDECGNTNARVQIIRVVDAVPPRFDPPPDVVIECGDSTRPDVLGAPSNRIDNCGSVTHTFADAPHSSGMDRVWTITDDCGNASTHTQRIRVIDTTDPVITCPLDLHLECDQSDPTGQVNPTDTGFATATDVCSAVTITQTDSVATAACQRVITRIWTASDSSGNTTTCTQTITLVDTTAPRLVCPPDLTPECDAITNTGFATATDNCSTATITWADQTTTSACARVIRRVWTATDACGNAATCTQTITFVDSAAPVLECPPDLTLDCDASANTGFATATDNCSTAAITWADQTTTSACARVIRRVWTANDACGNAATCTQTITFIDSTAPVLACPPDLTLDCDASANTGFATAADNCSTAAITWADQTTASACAWVIARNWTATDACGNAATCTQTITFIDTTAPVFDPPPDRVLACDPSDPAGQTNSIHTGVPSNLVDNCSTVLVMHTDTAPSGACDRVVTRVWTATDTCGNAVVHTQTITILASRADLQLTVVANPNRVVTSALVEVTLAITNAGSDWAIEIVLTNLLPNSLADVEILHPATGCEQDGDRIVCRLPDLPPKAVTSVVLQFELDPCCAGTLTNRAAVASGEPDADPADNRHQLTIPVADSEGDGEPDFADPDDDNDQIPDTWEAQHDLDPRDPSDATQDGDRDGADSLAEYMADTDPNDGASHLRIADLTHARTVAFPARHTRQYTLQSTSDLSTANWTDLLPHVRIDGIDGRMILTNQVPLNPLQHYRIVPSVPRVP